MSGIRIGLFGGRVPRRSPNLLDDTQSQVATNCRLTSGELRPYNGLKQILTLEVSPPYDIHTIYRYGQNQVGDFEYWFRWKDDVDIALGPVKGDEKERVYYTGSGPPKMTYKQIAIGPASSNLPLDYRDLGVPNPTEVVTLTQNGVSGVIVEGRVYTYTYVTQLGEESGPAPSSDTIQVFNDTGIVTVTFPASAQFGPGGKRDVAGIKLYRSVTGATGTEFQLVTTGQPIPLGTVTYQDTTLSQNLGEVLTTNLFEAPVPDLRGIVNMPNGFLAAFDCKVIYFSEPYQPHAWPGEYAIAVDFEVVGLGVIGQTLVILTKGTPYLAIGTHPAAMTLTKLEFFQACVSKESIVSTGVGVAYVSPDGICMVSQTGTDVVTRNLFTKEEWLTSYPLGTIHGSFIDNKYVGFYLGFTGHKFPLSPSYAIVGAGVVGQMIVGNIDITRNAIADVAIADMAVADTDEALLVSGGFIFDPAEPLGTWVDLDLEVTAAHTDLFTDSLYLYQNGTIMKWDDNRTTRLPYAWKSRVYTIPAPANMGAAQVDAADYPVVFSLYVDHIEDPVFTWTVTDREPFRLPSGFKSRDFEIGLEGNVAVRTVSVVETTRNLKQIPS